MKKNSLTFNQNSSWNIEHMQALRHFYWNSSFLHIQNRSCDLRVREDTVVMRTPPNSVVRALSKFKQWPAFGIK